ncbi:MAG TPA: hypothetical protein VMU64_14205 [Acidimicrobiales bacterium]|nr:hypothetical protein [Acidimicrobiales bacterium]
MANLGVKAFWHKHADVRSDAISSELAIHTERNTDEIKQLIADNTALKAAIKTNTGLLDEIHLHVANIGLKFGAEIGNFPPSSERPST